MITIQNKQDCCGCGACVYCCSKQCISMQEDDEGLLYPIVDKASCIDCGLCEKVCPIINQGAERKPLAVFAAKNPDEQIRKESSSGGIFTMLAERTIERGGVVFGAAFNEDWEVEHQYTETKEGLAAFRGSKYVQSKIGDNYKQAEKFLKQGRQVLFSGTSCQIAGLKLYLRKDWDNLFTVDVVCHGVPSPSVWSKYLEEITKRPKGAAGKNSVLSSLNSMPVITGISFRDKRLGWKKFGFAIRCAAPEEAAKNTVLQSDKYQENTWLYEPLNENLFMRGFLSNLYLRPSCYACAAKSGKSGSDITLGDFWGIWNHYPEFSDDKGESLVLINSTKGQQTFNSLQTENIPVSYSSALAGNPCIEHSVAIPKYRQEFFSTFNSQGATAIPFICNKMRPNLHQRGIIFAKRVARFIIDKIR